VGFYVLVQEASNCITISVVS